MLVTGRRLMRSAPDFWLGWYHFGFAATQKELGGIPDPALLAEAAAAGERLIALQPEHAEGYTVAAQALPAGRAREREALLRRAVQARPEECACSLQLLGDFLLQVGRFEEALAVFQRAADQNANAPLPNLRVALASYLMNRARAGDQAMRRFHAIAGPDWTPPDPALWAGRWSEAARFLRTQRPDEQAALIEALAALESRDPARIGGARAALERFPARADTELLIVPILAALGSTDSVLARLEDSRRRGSHYAAPGRYPGSGRLLLFDPLLRSIWSDPRFPAFLQRAGFIRYWRESRTRPDVCRAAGAPAFCTEIR
jgi:tetratricopeptide (TPR) repeat protein